MSKRRRIFFETQEVIQKTKRGYLDLDMDYFQFYNAAFSYVASLSSNCAKDFILWVMGRVDENNKFRYSKELLGKFNEDLSKISKPKEYAESTMNAALRELTDHNILLRASRGEYTVNPKLFWADEISERIKNVQTMETETRTIPENAKTLYPVFTDADFEENKLTDDNDVKPEETTEEVTEDGRTGESLEASPFEDYTGGQSEWDEYSLDKSR